MTETDPRLSLGEWLSAAYSSPEAGCPPPEAFLEAELAALAPAERRRLEAHADRCPACAAERDLARLFDAAPEAAGVRPEDVEHIVSRLAPPASQTAARVVPFRAPRPKVTRSPVWGRLAAAAGVALTAGLLFQTVGPGAPPLPDAPEIGGVVRGGEVEALSPVGELGAMPEELRWTPREGAHGYRVRLLAVDDTVLWEEAVSAPPARLPAEVVGTLHAAVSYLWSVEALDATGKRLAVSEPVRFRVKPGL